ncbi:MAG: site-specific integrase [Deltaproteobacteria bacterium]|nr:site-specific integrase [Deltaproteobacteria bacterium]
MNGQSKRPRKRHPGVYKVTGKRGVSYGIDFIHPQTGQRIRKILKDVKTEAEAAQVRAIEIADAARDVLSRVYGIKGQSKPILFEVMVDQYITWARTNKKSWKTDEYRGRALKRLFSRKLLSDITPFLVEKYKVIRAKKVEKATVNKELILGGQVFEKATEWGKWNGQNPFRIAPKFKVRKRQKPRSLLPEEVRAILDEVRHPVIRDMIEFDFQTGWRISEIRNLKWKDVDLNNSMAWIADPKNGEPIQVPLNDAALSIIERQHRRGEHVFCFKNGRPFKTNLTAGIRNAAVRAGVELPRRKAWHILRRTWASMFLQNGGDVETLRQLGNWKDYSMPLWYAAPANIEHQRAVLNRLPTLGARNKAEKGKVVSITH